MEFVFEWPRWCAGWQLKKVIYIYKHLGLIAEFDGCAFGLQNLRGWPLRKPRRVATMLEPLVEALSWRCNGTYHHGVT
eukprot:8402648-Heterocapsa_arctica.AAC.1